MIDPHAVADNLVQHNFPREQAERIAFMAWWVENVGPIRRHQLHLFFAQTFSRQKAEALADVFFAVSVDAYPIAYV